MEAIDTDGKRVAERTGDIAIHPVGVETADRGVQPPFELELRLPGDEVDRAARLPASKQGGAGSPENLDPLDARDVTRPAEAATGIEAVDQITARQILIAGKAAHRVIVPQAAEIVLSRH